jgi:hypothetical protein
MATAPCQQRRRMYFHRHRPLAGKAHVFSYHCNYAVCAQYLVHALARPLFGCFWALFLMARFVRFSTRGIQKRIKSALGKVHVKNFLQKS